jgi:phthiocerol/phenolphthiocerol synthesis type-I polyketide synthase E
MSWSGSGSIQTLPNGLRVRCQTRFELQHFYADIFEHEVYVRHGITLADDARVVDIGANIGLFSVYVQERWPESAVLAFEPAPPLFHLLQQNVARYGANVRCFNLGISNRSGTISFTYYPNSSGMSSFYADREEERQALTRICENEAREVDPAVAGLLPHLDDYLAMRLETETFQCEVRTLSQVLCEQGIERVDLLKIDAQKSEWDILQGLEEADWPRVGQLVAEVHDFDGRLRQMTELLSARGFAVVTEQDPLYRQSQMHNLYAVRASAPA